MKCKLTSSDPRLAGTTEEKWNADIWNENGAWLLQWGDITLRNGGGTWVGRFTGFYTPKTRDIMTFWLSGSGGYSGLSLYMMISETSSGNVWPWRAVIFPGRLPSIVRTDAPSMPSSGRPSDSSSLVFVTGTADCTFGPGSTTRSEGIEHGRDGKIGCTVTTSDPRVSGGADEVWQFDHWSQPDGDWVVQWGDATLKNDAGTWLGRYTGVTTPQTGVMNMAWYTGKGAYEGLSYGYIVTQPTIGDPSIRGMIFPGTPPTS